MPAALQQAPITPRTMTIRTRSSSSVLVIRLMGRLPWPALSPAARRRLSRPGASGEAPPVDLAARLAGEPVPHGRCRISPSEAAYRLAKLLHRSVEGPFEVAQPW